MKFLPISYGMIGDTMGKKILAGLLCVIFVLLLTFGGLNYEMSMAALTIWFEKLVPSMFGIMVFVKVMFSLGILRMFAIPLGKVFGPLFRVDQDSFTYVIAMLFLGFPAGAAFIDEQVKNHRLSVSAGRRLINSCSFATPGFVIMTCGSVLFHSVHIGITLFLIQIIAGLCMLFLTRGTAIKDSFQPYHTHSSFMNILSDAMLDSGKTLYMIGGYLMLCMSICAVLVQGFPDFIQSPLRIISEFSSGAVLISEMDDPINSLLMILSMLLSFGGLCVHMQVMSMSDHCELSYGRYLSYRIIQAMIAGGLAMLLF